MKKLLATTGGRPLKNEDAQLFQQLITLLEGFSSDVLDGLIMSGVEITGTPGNYDISSGYIYYSGSICTFVAVTGVALPYVMEKFETDGTPRDFFDAATKNTINFITISAQGGGGYSLELTSPRLSEYTLRKATESEMIAATPDVCVEPALLVGSALGSDPTDGVVTLTISTNNIKTFYGLKRVQFSGNIAYSDSILPDDSLIATIPSTSWNPAPTEDIYGFLFIQIGGGANDWTALKVKFTTSREIRTIEASAVNIAGTNPFHINLVY